MNNVVVSLKSAAIQREDLDKQPVSTSTGELRALVENLTKVLLSASFIIICIGFFLNPVSSKQIDPTQLNR